MKCEKSVYDDCEFVKDGECSLNDYEREDCCPCEDMRRRVKHKGEKYGI